MDRLTFWELVAAQVPVEPAPSFLKSEKIFDEPDVSQREEFAHDGLWMAKIGEKHSAVGSGGGRIRAGPKPDAGDLAKQSN